MEINSFYTEPELIVMRKFDGTDNAKRILLLNTHMGTNIGDNLITNAELLFFAKYLPDFQVIEFSAEYIETELEWISRFVHPSDIIAISGGGYLGSLWLVYGENNVREIIKSFPENNIIILPQTLFFEDSEEGRKQLQISKEIYNSHAHLSLCLRERNSFCLAQSLLGPHVKLFCFPDMAALMDCSAVLMHRNGIGICLRNDKESVLTEEDKLFIENRLKATGADLIYFDMHADSPITDAERGNIILQKITQIMKLNLVITDRLHCMMLCAITGTPCIAIDNLSQKVSGVYKWLENNKYIYMPGSIYETDLVTHFNSINQKTNIYDHVRIDAYFEKLAELFLSEKMESK